MIVLIGWQNIAGLSLIGAALMASAVRPLRWFLRRRVVDRLMRLTRDSGWR